ncbi:hypothetical protein M5K25_025317 [Dendrobium thyrsiflorum]|uniref:Uncharacterized protein n=1 Tax=Dendrobium thyrsiflorum TaxID=117978 RepID=A0ABD0U3V6_DENTH
MEGIQQRVKENSGSLWELGSGTHLAVVCLCLLSSPQNHDRQNSGIWQKLGSDSVECRTLRSRPDALLKALTFYSRPDVLLKARRSAQDLTFLLNAQHSAGLPADPGVPPDHCQTPA